MIVCALLLTLTGAVLVYLAHARQQLLRTVLPVRARIAGMALVAASSVAWSSASGSSAGVAGAMTTLMFAWVALPYVAWWRGKHVRVVRGEKQ